MFGLVSGSRPRKSTPDVSLYFLSSQSYRDMDFLNIFLVTTSVVAFAYTVHFVYLDSARLRGEIVEEAKSRKRAWHLRVGPVVCSILAIIAFVLILLPRNSRSEACLPENNEINPDVGGIGVLLGLFLPCLVLLLVLILGHFTAHTSGAKELCIAQFASKLRRAMKRISGLTQHRLVLSHNQSCQGDEKIERSRAWYCHIQC